MKVRAVFAIVALFTIVGRSPAGSVDKAKLRELARLPTVPLIFGYGVSTISGFEYAETSSPDRKVEIARLQKQMKDDPSDAERYILLGRHHNMGKREKEAKECWSKAIAICRQQLREHPDDTSWLIRLGDALTHDGQAREAEPLLRRAVKEAPKEWRGWLALAECVDDLAYRHIIGDKEVSYTFQNPEPMIAALRECKPMVQQIAEMRWMWEEAGGYFARAIELAPADEAKPSLRRVASSLSHGFVNKLLRMAQQEKANSPEKKVLPEAVFLAPEILPDLRRLARLTPDDPQKLGSAMTLEILTCVSHNKLEMNDDCSSWADFLALQKRSLIDVLPAENRESVRWCLERLEQLTKHPDKTKAAVASEILALWLIEIQELGEHKRAALPISSTKRQASVRVLEHLRRAVQLDPSRERAWDSLTALLAKDQKIAEAIAVTRERIAIKDNARNRFFLAKAYAESDQFDKAAEALRAGLKSDPTDLNCLLGLIALALKRGNAESLQEAGEQLDAIAVSCKVEGSKQHGSTSAPGFIEKQQSKQRLQDYLLLRGIHSALMDRPDQAKAAFQQVLKMKKGEPTATRALVALGEPLGPSDRKLAIDYVDGIGGRGWLKDRQADSPVMGISLSRSEVTDEDLFVLTAFPQLDLLYLSFSALTDAGLAHLKHLTALQTLDLDYVNITDKGLVHLKALRGLHNLSIDETKITDAGLAHLEAFPDLENLQIACSSGIDGKETITDAGLAHLRNLPKLRAVTVGSSITDKGLAHLAAFPHLRRLLMLSSKITDKGMQHMERLTELEELWLSNAEITDAGLVHLKGLRNLQKLHLGGNKITDAGLAHLKDMSRLEELELDSTAVSDAGLAYLSGLTNLRKLNLRDSDRKKSSLTVLNKPPLTGQGLKYLQGMTKLTHLELDGRPITDAGLTDIEKLTQIEYLSLDTTSITDAGLEHFRPLKQLRLANVRRTKVTRQGIAELRKTLPKLEVYR